MAKPNKPALDAEAKKRKQADAAPAKKLGRNRDREMAKSIGRRFGEK